MRLALAKGGMDKGNLKLTDRVSQPDEAQDMKFPVHLPLI